MDGGGKKREGEKDLKERREKNCGQDTKTRAKIDKNILNKLINHKVLIV